MAARKNSNKTLGGGEKGAAAMHGVGGRGDGWHGKAANDVRDIGATPMEDWKTWLMFDPPSPWAPLAEIKKAVAEFEQCLATGNYENSDMLEDEVANLRRIVLGREARKDFPLACRRMDASTREHEGFLARACAAAAKDTAP